LVEFAVEGAPDAGFQAGVDPGVAGLGDDLAVDALKPAFGLGLGPAVEVGSGEVLRHCGIMRDKQWWFKWSLETMQRLGRLDGKKATRINSRSTNQFLCDNERLESNFPIFICVIIKTGP
jgi:hypothetical protein